MGQKKKLFIKTYGCQMNVYDSQKMGALLNPLGFESTERLHEADMVILNTCHIREKAEEKVFSDLGRIRQTQKEGAILAVAGCVAQAEGQEIMRRAPFVDIVLGPQTYHRLPEMVARAVRARDGETHKGTRAGLGMIDTDFPTEIKFDFFPEVNQATEVSAFLSIQEGCDRFCTFCVVPYTRGAEYSRPVADIVGEAQNLVARGALEITLLGQNVNAYHGMNPAGKEEWRLARLIEEIAYRVPGLKRLRYTTSHPRDMTEDLIAAHRDIPILMPYLHLPVQSGSDTILEKMNRQHTASDYLKIIEKVKKNRPDIALSSDFIVGFPGETEADFTATLRLVESVEFAQAYSFKYSPRPGTPAATYEAHVPEAIQNERLERLQSLLQRHQLAFNKASVGATVPVLFEKLGKKPGQIIGKSPYLQSVYIEAASDALGKIYPVTVTQGFQNSVTGYIAPQSVKEAS